MFSVETRFNNCIIGEDCEIAPTAVLGKGCKLGNKVIIHHGAVLYDGIIIGDNVEIFENSVIGRPPKSAGNIVSKMKSAFEPVTIGNNSVIGAGVVIYAECRIANNVLLGDNMSMRECCVVEEYALLARLVTLNHHVTVGHHSKIMDATHITAHSTLEDNVFIGVNVSTTNDSSMRISGAEVGIHGGITFKSGCKIGSGSIFLPGITVGESAVVAAGAVVTKNVLSNVTVMGMPARERAN